jgi:hypothetical protein
MEIRILYPSLLFKDANGSKAASLFLAEIGSEKGNPGLRNCEYWGNPDFCGADSTEPT